MGGLQTVDPSAPQTQSARPAWRVSMRSVGILALALVDGTPSAESFHIRPNATAPVDTRVIRTLVAIRLSPVSMRIRYPLPTSSYHLLVFSPAFILQPLLMHN